MVIEIGTVVAFVESGWEMTGRSHEQTFWGKRNTVYLDWSEVIWVDIVFKTHDTKYIRSG